MSMNRNVLSVGVARAARVLPVILLLAGSAVEVLAQSPANSKKMKREIEVMENILDQVVIDSRNVLVPSRHSVHGVYLPEFGVLFTTEASLLTRDWEHNNWGGFNWRNVEHKGDRIIIHKDDWDDEDDDRNDNDGRTWRQRLAAREEKLYAGAKEELIDALIDFGDTVSSLRDDEWIGLTVHLGDSELFRDRKISTYTIKARMGDIRAHSRGTLNRTSMMNNLVQSEY
jgi:hypothetical protein